MLTRLIQAKKKNSLQMRSIQLHSICYSFCLPTFCRLNQKWTQIPRICNCIRTVFYHRFHWNDRMIHTLSKLKIKIKLKCLQQNCLNSTKIAREKKINYFPLNEFKFSFSAFGMHRYRKHFRIAAIVTAIGAGTKCICASCSFRHFKLFWWEEEEEKF